MLRGIFTVRLLAFVVLFGCESKDEDARSKAARAAETNVQPGGEAKRRLVVRRTPDGELLARPPSPPISVIETDSPRTDGHRSRPLLEVEHATGGGTLRFDGKCLFLESGADKVGIVFRNATARFDRTSNELLVSGVRVKAGETMFVRATWWGGPSFLGFELKPPLADECARDHYWLVDTVGVGIPTSEDLDCDGEVESNRGHKVIMEPLAVQGGLEQQAEQAFHHWRRTFGIVRVCAEKHVPSRIGTMLDEQLTVSISREGSVADITFPDDKYTDMVGCMKGYLAQETPFPPARQESGLILRLRVLLGNSDYQIATCDHLRGGE